MSGIRETHGAKKIGKYGFAHWTDKPVTPDEHKLALVPQTIMDGWEGYCSCGEWKGFASFYDIEKRDDLLAAMKAAHARHAAPEVSNDAG